MRIVMILALAIGLMAVGAQADDACMAGTTAAPASMDCCAHHDAAATKMTKTDSQSCTAGATMSSAESAADEACHMSEAAKMMVTPSACETAAKVMGSNVQAAADACTAKSAEDCAAQIAAKSPGATEQEIAATASACAAARQGEMQMTKSEMSDGCSMMSKTDAIGDTAGCPMMQSAKAESSSCHSEMTATKADESACHMSGAAKMMSSPAASETAAKAMGSDVQAAADACTAKSEEACAARIAAKVPDASDEEVAEAAAACAAERQGEMQMSKTELPECCAAKLAEMNAEEPTTD